MNYTANDNAEEAKDNDGGAKDNDGGLLHLYYESMGYNTCPASGFTPNPGCTLEVLLTPLVGSHALRIFRISSSQLKHLKLYGYLYEHFKVLISLNGNLQRLQEGNHRKLPQPKFPTPPTKDELQDELEQDDLQLKCLLLAIATIRVHEYLDDDSRMFLFKLLWKEYEEIKSELDTKFTGWNPEFWTENDAIEWSKEKDLLENREAHLSYNQLALRLQTLMRQLMLTLNVEKKPGAPYFLLPRMEWLNVPTHEKNRGNFVNKIPSQRLAAFVGVKHRVKEVTNTYNVMKTVEEKAAEFMNDFQENSHLGPSSQTVCSILDTTD
tara:strand:+ start:164 stop:1132 length:969 start_codon:yes stop_codon:yes gene_type:complete